MTVVSVRNNVPVLVIGPPARPVPAAIEVTEPALLTAHDNAPLPLVVRTLPLTPSAAGRVQITLAPAPPLMASGALKPTYLPMIGDSSLNLISPVCPAPEPYGATTTPSCMLVTSMPVVIVLEGVILSCLLASAPTTMFCEGAISVERPARLSMTVAFLALAGVK